MSDCSKAKVRDDRTVGAIHKDVFLAGYQYGCGTKFTTFTYSLEVTMNYIARVEVAETLSDVG